MSVYLSVSLPCIGLRDLLALAKDTDVSQLPYQVCAFWEISRTACPLLTDMARNVEVQRVLYTCRSVCQAASTCANTSLGDDKQSIRLQMCFSSIRQTYTCTCTCVYIDALCILPHICMLLH